MCASAVPDFDNSLKVQLITGNAYKSNWKWQAKWQAKYWDFPVSFLRWASEPFDCWTTLQVHWQKPQYESLLLYDWVCYVLFPIFLCDTRSHGLCFAKLVDQFLLELWNCHHVQNVLELLSENDGCWGAPNSPIIGLDLKQGRLPELGNLLPTASL